MLTYDSLLEQAKLRGMPVTKMRGILREYLQVLVLKELYRTGEGKKLFFTGGTYLRLIHNFKRFSEDLDFNSNNLTRKEFENILASINIELKRTGINSTVHFSHRKNMYISSIVFPEVEKFYNIISKYSGYGGILIKVETNKPVWKIKKEIGVVSGFGEVFPCICTDRGALFADKIDALLKKERNRHIYDIIFMLSNKYPIDRRVLDSLGITKDPKKVIIDRINSFSTAELKRQAESLRPFLFDEKEFDLILNARIIIPQLLENYSFER